MAGAQPTLTRGPTLLPDGIVHDDVVVAFSGSAVAEVRQPRAGDPAPRRELLIPGLVNAHTHLELSWTAPVPGGAGFVPWAGALMGQERPPDDVRHAATRAAAARLVELGVAAVSDICGEGSTADVLLDAGLAGVAQVELLGFDRERAERNGERAASLARSHGRSVFTRAAAHAPYSTAPDLIRAALAPPGADWPPGSVHLAEDAAEDEFIASGTGPFAALLDRLGVDWSWWEAPGGSPVAYLHALGVLGPDTLVVHGVHVGPSDRRTLADTRTPVCLCPRSNQHIGGQIPDVPDFLQAGVHLCVGTDSLGSAPDLDVLAEIPVLCNAFPDVPVARWLSLTTDGGARALRLPRLGRFVVGASPGALLLDADPEGLRNTPPARRWLVRPDLAPQEVA